MPSHVDIIYVENSTIHHYVSSPNDETKTNQKEEI